MPTARKVRRIVVTVVLLAAAAAGGAWYLKREKPPEAPKWRTESVANGTVVMSVTATGTLSAVKTVLVGSQVSGIVARLHADFNSRVQKGQLLAELDPTNFEAIVQQRRADVASADVRMRNAETAYKRQQRLLAEQLAAQEAYDNAKATYETSRTDVDQARAALTQAETNLRYTRIVSPVDGVVVDRQYDVGQTVAASFQAPTLFTIAQDLTRMQVQADVDQSDIGRLEVGQPAHFTVDAYPDEEFHGTITQVRLNATVTQNVITYPVIIEVDNPGEKLRPKMTADVSIEVARADNVLRIPNAALRFRPPESALAGKDAGKKEGGGAAAGSRAGTGGEAAAAPAGETPRAPGADAPRAGGRRGRRGPGGGGEPGANGPGGGGPGAGGPGAGGPAFAGDGAQASESGARGGRPGRPNRHEATIYVLAGKDTLSPVAITTGITDGRFTEITGGGLKPGDAVVVGQPTSKDEGGGRSFGMSGMGPGGPGGGRRGM